MKNNPLLVSAFLMAIAACEKTIDMTTQKGKGIYYARVVNKIVHQEFLQYYPLNEQDKSNCVNKLADKYLRRNIEDK